MSRSKLTVTACDRNGHRLASIVIIRASHHEILADRGIAFEQLRSKHVDCQIYFTWSAALASEHETSPLSSPRSKAAAIRTPTRRSRKIIWRASRAILAAVLIVAPSDLGPPRLLKRDAIALLSGSAWNGQLSSSTRS